MAVSAMVAEWWMTRYDGRSFFDKWAQVVVMVGTRDLKSRSIYGVRVQVPPWAPLNLRRAQA